MHRRDGLTPCYHVVRDGKAVCGAANPFWRAFIATDGTVCYEGPAAMIEIPSSMLCGRCERIIAR